MKILVVDDHPLLREALREILKQLDASIGVLEAGDAAGALEATGRDPDLDLILLDIQLPGRSGLDVLSDLRAQHPGIPVVVLSASEAPDDVMRAIDSGAMGFIPKSQSTRVLINALRLVLAGGVYLPTAMLGHAPPPSATPAPAGTAPGAGKTPADIGLTQRQADVLGLLVQGKPNKLICHELGMAVGTVKVHISAILQTLGVLNRTQAVIAASRLGLKFGGISNSSANLERRSF